MGALTIPELKQRFATLDLPTQKDYSDLIDTLVAKINATAGNLIAGGAFFYAPAILSGNTYTASYPTTVTAYLDGTILAFKANAENPAGAILFDAGNGPVEVVKHYDMVLEKGDIRAHQIVEVRFNGTIAKWQVISGLSRATGRSGDIIVSGAPLAADATRLACDGTSYLRTDYPSLFAAIGTTHGSADGTHFNVPDMRRRVPIGVGLLALAPAGPPSPVDINLGSKNGEEIHLSNFVEMPRHFHGMGTLQFDGVDETTFALIARNWSSDTYSEQMTSGDGARHMQIVSNESTGGFATSNPVNAGLGNNAHNNLQPYLGLYFYILT